MAEGEDAVPIVVDGVEVRASAGRSVGAALVEHGIVAWRTTRRTGRPRGLFCGIGVCFDCLLTIDGVPDQRACLVPIAAGMTVETAAPAGTGEADADEADAGDG